LRPTKKNKKIIEFIKLRIKSQKVPSWLKLDPEKLEGKVENTPKLKDISPPFNTSKIFEFYSK
jgi:Ribosomal protein S4 and related proteins